ncbi:hypothetical protein RUMTOR_02928 [[Ruminococcus] torques ATCC 27756]|uniref:Uncharacterized protein n=2 Tax=[Ruminococcus] torques TaxID=33039 RepID=A5KRM9_9FIRM|nr:hypothetical protein RUMTOR_02928 [[Ruminococcus] torques ATCC 27756]
MKEGEMSMKKKNNGGPFGTRYGDPRRHACFCSNEGAEGIETAADAENGKNFVQGVFE